MTKYCPKHPKQKMTLLLYTYACDECDGKIAPTENDAVRQERTYASYAPLTHVAKFKTYQEIIDALLKR